MARVAHEIVNETNFEPNGLDEISKYIFFSSIRNVKNIPSILFADYVRPLLITNDLNLFHSNNSFSKLKRK